MCLALVIWQEIPTRIQAAGIVLAVAAMVLMNLPEVRTTAPVRRSGLTLILLLAATGLGDFSGKLFEKYALPETAPLFLAVLFSTALAVSLWTMIRSLLKGAGFAFRDVPTGLAVGIPNLFTTFFLVKAFATVKATLAFPLFSSGTILAITLGGILIFHERPGRRDSAAIVMITAGVALMGL